MRYFLMSIGFLLLVFWAISLFFKLFGAVVNVALVLALLILAYTFLKPMPPKNDA